MPKLRKNSIYIVLILLFLTQSTLISFAQTSVTKNTSVSLTVQLRDQDVPISISRVSDNQTAEEDELVTYQITYGSLLSFAVPLTIQASWADASINGSLVNLADYVNGSGTDAYNGTPAVVDTVNRVVSWSIPSIPANTTNQIVSFTLRMNSNYTGDSTVSFAVSAGANSSGATITPISITQYYHHTQPTTTSTTNTPTPVRSIPTPTPTIPPIVNTISSINIDTISSNSAVAHVLLATPAKLTIRYGTSPSSMLKSIKVPELVTDYSIEFPDLIPKTQYYFSILATTSTGTTSSDIYTFTTAKGSTSSFVNLTSLIITANNTILSSDPLSLEKTISGENQMPTTIITINTPFEFRFAVSDSEKIRKIEALVRLRKKVLGINSYSPSNTTDASSDSVEIVEISHGVYSGRLKAKLKPGSYMIYARITDIAGNITEQALSRMTIVNPLTILEEGSKNPIENARVLFFRKNPRSNNYTLLSDQSIATKNPVFSNPDGTISTNLIQGDYKIQISATGYKQQESYFTISTTSESQYPTIYLKKDAYSVISTVQFYSEVTGDFFSSFMTFVTTLGVSNRLFKLLSLVSLCFFIIVTLLSFCIRYHVPVSAVPAYFFSLLHWHRRKNTLRMLSGVVKDEAIGGYPVDHAIIYLLDRNRKRILLHTQTNNLGMFTITLPPAPSYLLLIKKRHYISLEYIVTSREDIQIYLEKDPGATNQIIATIQLFFQNLLGLCFEILLFLSLVFEAIFMMSLGVVTVAPYLFLSIANLVLWLLFVKNQRSIYST